MEFDLVIRGGTIIDGSGGEPLAADLAVRDGRIAAIGPNLDAGAEEIDARGRIVTPGFVDVHTHDDGQAIWSQRLNPSSSHGVTTPTPARCSMRCPHSTRPVAHSPSCGTARTQARSHPHTAAPTSPAAPMPSGDDAMSRCRR